MCYDARDAYHRCLDKFNASDELCASQLQQYADACPGSWRTYFDKQRERQVMLELQTDRHRQRGIDGGPSAPAS